MTPQELKSSILQLAIQGKLVEQRPEEGTGEELYQQIGRIKDGLPQKKESSRTIILEDDCTNKKVQMELSDSAYRLLYYLYKEDWLDSDDIHFTELDEKKIERFI